MSTNRKTDPVPPLARLLAETIAGDDDNSDAARWAGALLEDAVRERATDIHLDPMIDSLRVRFRVDGRMREAAMLGADQGSRLMRIFKAGSDLDPAPALLPEDAHSQFEVGGHTLDLRVSCAPCVGGEKMAMRLLQRSRVGLRLTELGLFDDQRERIERWLGDINGMFVVAGPTGSGKTTTLYAMLAELQLSDRSVVTIEDPIEYQVEGVTQMQVDAKRGLSFAAGLRASMRLDPDYILLGEIRDEETAGAALEAASSGHVVLTTMHSRDAAGAVTMLRSFGLPDNAIAATLAFVVSERLVRELCPECRRQQKPTEADLRWLRAMGRQAPKTTWSAPGCEACRQTGYFGSTGIFQVWPVEAKSYELILSGSDDRALRDHLATIGTRSLLESGMEKAAAGVTDFAELRTMGIQSYLEPSGNFETSARARSARKP